MALGDTINEAFGLKSACAQIADVGRRHLFEAMELISIFREIADHITRLKLDIGWEDDGIHEYCQSCFDISMHADL